MRKLAAGMLLAVLLLSAIGCSCTVEKQAFVRVQSAQKNVNDRYLKYVNADTTLDAAQKQDERKRVEELDKLMKAVINLFK